MVEERYGREADVDVDEQVANSRATGDDADTEDTEDSDGSPSTTGTGGSGEFVGRAAGEDSSAEEESGAEARSTPDR
jgi:hypothetical protein